VGLFLWCSPGNSADKELGIKLTVKCINHAHEETKELTIVLGNSADGPNSIGNKFEDLRVL